MKEYALRTRMESEGHCPIHMTEKCPGGCDYWAKSRAVDAKVEDGMCAYNGCCARLVPPASLCAVHFAMMKELESRAVRP